MEVYKVTTSLQFGSKNEKNKIIVIQDIEIETDNVGVVLELFGEDYNDEVCMNWVAESDLEGTAQEIVLDVGVLHVIVDPGQGD